MRGIEGGMAELCRGLTDEIAAIIQSSLPDATVIVQDPFNDGQHFEAVVMSPSFTGLPLIKQHQLVMRPLTEAFKEKVHALSLKTFTPEKWESVKADYL